MCINWWLASYFMLALMGVGVIFEKHGKPKTGKYNAWSEIIAYAIVYFILYKAGLFGLFFK